MSHKKCYLNDEEIVRKIRFEKESELYYCIYKKYFPKVLDKCFSLTHNRVIAKELTEDILSKAFEKLNSFKGNASFSSWLYAITYNQCIDYLREKKRLHYPDWNSENLLPEIVDETYNDEEEISSDKLMDLLNKLHTEEKALIMMKYFDDMSLKQIAESLRITESAAKMRLKRAKTRLMFLYKNNTGYADD